MKKIYILGSGGLAQEVYGWNLCQKKNNRLKIDGFISNDSLESLFGLPILSKSSVKSLKDDFKFIPCIGDINNRRNEFESLEKIGGSPYSFISDDVKIGASTLDSAASKAAAINALTSEHGVTATATTTVFLDLDFSKAATDTSFEINGTAITIADDDNIKDVAAIINTIVLEGSVHAEADETGLLKLTSVGGDNIRVTNTVSGFVAGATDINNVAVTTSPANNYVIFGALSLTSESGGPIKLEDISTSNAGLAKLGLQGGSEALAVTHSGVDVTTEANSLAALAEIDSAIAKVTNFRSSFGAVENRLDAKINNMTTLKVNTQAAQSRIQDADFAAETTNLTKSQILSQAATSMLAQANASKQNLLALLQG